MFHCFQFLPDFAILPLFRLQGLCVLLTLPFRLLFDVFVHYELQLPIVDACLFVLRHLQLLKGFKPYQILGSFARFYISSYLRSKLVVIGLIKFFDYSSNKIVVSRVILAEPFVICFERRVERVFSIILKQETVNEFLLQLQV